MKRINKLKNHQRDVPFDLLCRDTVQKINNTDALAIWVYLQSLPEDWIVRESHIRDKFGIGRTRYMRAMRVLREMGLYRVERPKGEDGGYTGAYYHVYPFPQVSKTIPIENSTYYKEEDINTEKDIATEEYIDMYQNEFGTPKPKKPAPQKKPKKPKQFQYPQEFEDLWALRPRRDGGNPKRQAFNAYKARLREGHTHDEMLDGMLRYAKNQEAAGNIDTPYVQQLATFFGPSLAFTEAWDIKPKKKPQSRSDRFREEAETIRKMSEWADEQIKNQGSTDWRLLK